MEEGEEEEEDDDENEEGDVKDQVRKGQRSVVLLQ